MSNITKHYFIDTNILVYLFDKSSSFNAQVSNFFQIEINKEADFCLSHLILEEFIHVMSELMKLTGVKNYHNELEEFIVEISNIPRIKLIRPKNNFKVAVHVLKLCNIYNIHANDAYILSTMIDGGVGKLLTFDKKLATAANKNGIHTIF